MQARLTLVELESLRRLALHVDEHPHDEVGRARLLARTLEAASWAEAASADGWVMPDSAIVDLGTVLCRLKLHAVALGWCELALSRVGGWVVGDWHHRIGVCLDGLGQTEAAIASFEQAARPRPDDAGRLDHDSMAISLHRVGECCAELGRWEQAAENFRAAADEASCGDVSGTVSHGDVGQSLHRLGYALVELGRHRQAIESFELAIAAKERGAEDVSQTQHEIGYCFGELDEPVDALSWHERALLSGQKADDPARITTAVEHIVWTLQMGDGERALEWLRDGPGSRHQGSLGGVRYSQLVGECLIELDRWDEAIVEFERALAESFSAAPIDHASAGQSLSMVGLCHLHRRRWQAAIDSLTRAIDEYGRGDARGRVSHDSIGAAWYRIGESHEGRKAWAEALACHERAIEARQLGDVAGQVDFESISWSMIDAARCLKRLGDWQRAHSFRARALAVSTETGDLELIGLRRYALAVSLAKLGAVAAALLQLDEVETQHEDLEELAELVKATRAELVSR